MMLSKNQLKVILTYTGLKWWAYQDLNLGPIDYADGRGSDETLTRGRIVRPFLDADFRFGIKNVLGVGRPYKLQLCSKRRQMQIPLKEYIRRLLRAGSEHSSPISTQLENIFKHFFPSEGVPNQRSETPRRNEVKVGLNNLAFPMPVALNFSGLRFLDMSSADFSAQDLLRRKGAHVDRPPLDLASLRALSGQYDGLFCHGGINSSNFSGQEQAHQQYLDAMLATTREEGLVWISPNNNPADFAAIQVQKNFFEARGCEVHELNEGQTCAHDFTKDFGVSACYPKLIYTKNLSPRWHHEDYNHETIFPKTLLKEMAEILWEKNGEFAVYRDFPVLLDDPIQDQVRYGEEWARFKNQAQGRPPVVLLHHDADHTPYKTVDLMEYEHSLGIRSSAYFFYEQNLSNRYEPYTLDIKRLQSLENSGFEIGYHLNAYEMAGYELDKAFDLIKRDLDFLEQHFRVTSFVPHGGVPGPFGMNNHLIPHSGVLREYQWPEVGRGISYDYAWSDGMVHSEQIQDPRDIIRNLDDGQRARLLMHPQYYGDKLSHRHEKYPLLAKEKWWRELWGL